MPDINPQDFVNNPLTGADFQIKARTVKDGSWVKDDEGIITLKEIDLDRADYVKLYRDKEIRLTIALLSPRAQRLLLWIMFETEAGQDYLWINVKRYMKENHIEDRKTYRTAVTELSRYMIIHKHSNYKTVFWINPRYFFAGSRIKKYPNSVVYVSDEPTAKPEPIPTPVQPVEQQEEPPSEYKVQ